MQQLTTWCKDNNLSLNFNKTKEMGVDFRRAQSGHSPLFIDRSSVEIVKSTKLLGVHLAENFTWSLNTSSIGKKAQVTIKSILSSGITAWFGNCTISDRKT
ncbi:hypothetical protein QTP70_024420, partial [Hemibagrus guttatus]